MGDLLGVVVGDRCGVEVGERLEVDEVLLHWSDLLGLLPSGRERLKGEREKSNVSIGNLNRLTVHSTTLILAVITLRCASIPAATTLT